MPVLTLLTFFTLSLSLLSVWIKRSIRVWASFLLLSLVFGFFAGSINGIGLLIVAGWALIWKIYLEKHTNRSRWIVLIGITLLSFGFKFHLFSGFNPTLITTQFFMGLETPLLGLFPLALLIPLAKKKKEWQQALKGTVGGCLGIVLLALLAWGLKAVHWQFKLPSHFAERLSYNLILTTIPEEAFYRGFLQRELTQLLSARKSGKWLAVILTSCIFTVAHIYWSPSLDILGFVFLASSLYGTVYLFFKRIESAILCHFILNTVHMIFFSYHAL